MATSESDDSSTLPDHENIYEPIVVVVDGEPFDPEDLLIETSSHEVDNEFQTVTRSQSRKRAAKRNKRSLTLVKDKKKNPKRDQQTLEKQRIRTAIRRLDEGVRERERARDRERKRIKRELERQDEQKYKELNLERARQRQAKRRLDESFRERERARDRERKRLKRALEKKNSVDS